MVVIESDARFLATKLGSQEGQVLALYVGGMELPQLADRLAITETSVRDCLSRIRADYSDANHEPQ